MNDYHFYSLFSKNEKYVISCNKYEEDITEVREATLKICEWYLI